MLQVYYPSKFCSFICILCCLSLSGCSSTPKNNSRTSTIDSTVPQQKPFIPDPNVKVAVDNAWKAFGLAKDEFTDCAWKEISILSNAKESVEATAIAAKTMCGRQWVKALDAMGTAVNTEWAASDGRRIELHKPVFERQMMDLLRSLVIRYRGLTN